MQFDRLEDLWIICVGTVMHLLRLSLFGMNYPTAVQLVPNSASTLLTTTLLATLTKWRPLRGPPGSNLNRAQHIFRLLVELIVIVCSVEFLLVQTWIPLLLGLVRVCEWVTEGYIEQNLPELAKGINDGYFNLIRFLLAASLAVAIGVIQGWLSNNNLTGQPKDQVAEDKPEAGEVDPSQHSSVTEPYNRPIIIRYSGGSTRNRNLEPLVIRSVTLDESSV